MSSSGLIKILLNAQFVYLQAGTPKFPEWSIL